MTRDIKDIITDMREIVKPCIAQMLFNENFEGKGNTDKAEFETEFEMLLTLAERGATVEPQEWISVKDRLPKDAKAVLITIRRRDKSFNQNPFISVGYISWNQQAWWCAHDGDCKENNIEVLAWKPLPSPYKGEEDNETETWNGIHAQITAPKGTFDKIWNDTDAEDDI